MDDVKWMKEAIKQAKKAESYDEVPIGCVIVKDDKVIARGYNKRETLQQSIAHAEIMAIQKACKKLNTWRLEDCILYVTLEPCEMCKLLIQESRINHVYYLQKRGILNNKYNQTKYEQMYAFDSVIFDALMENFFKKIREKK